MTSGWKWLRNWGELLLWKIITSVSSFIVESNADVSVKSRDLKPLTREMKKKKWMILGTTLQ